MTLREEKGRWLCTKSKKAKRSEDVTDIIVFDGDFCSVMGKAGRTEFHAYLHKNGNQWQQMYGVTSLLGYWGEKERLVQWAVDRGIEFIRGKLDAGLLPDDLVSVTSCGEFLDVLEESRTAHKRSLNDASDKGKDVHAEVEEYIKKAISYGGRMPGVLPVGSEQAQLFMKWAEENNVEFLASEKVVYSKRLWVAGTLDFLCRIDGKLMIGDVKTSNWVSPKHFLQCGAYAKFYEEMEATFLYAGDVEVKRTWPAVVEGIVIVNLPRSGGIKIVTNEDVGQTVDNLKRSFESVVQLVRTDKDISSNLYN